MNTQKLAQAQPKSFERAQNMSTILNSENTSPNEAVVTQNVQNTESELFQPQIAEMPVAVISSQPTETIKDNYRTGVFFFIMIGAGLLISMVIYASAHGLNYFKMFSEANNQKWNVDFIGGGRNAYSVGIETTAWAFWGVSCRTAYLALKALLEGKFQIFKYIALWLGTIAFAWGVSVALILSLSVISLNVGTTQITLANASIETIMAIAFIIGFFNEQALKLLEQVRDRLTGRIDQEPPQN
jgi:hypothetical protein